MYLGFGFQGRERPRVPSASRVPPKVFRNTFDMWGFPKIGAPFLAFLFYLGYARGAPILGNTDIRLG